MHHTVTVTSTALPTLRWRCSRCAHDEFECSRRFRMNSNGRLADIWLIYRCARCEATKNLTVVERTPVNRIARDLFDAATANDAAFAASVARDVALLKAAGATVATGDRFDVHPAPGRRSSIGVVQVVLAEPMLVRLDHVVAACTAQSPSEVRRLQSLGAVEVIDGRARIDRLRQWRRGPVAHVTLADAHDRVLP